MNAMPPVSLPSISVILVCKNPGPRLEAALASVWRQRDVAPEVIVIDGASTDGTLALLEKNRARIATLHSGPDRGVYDAMNRGLAAAHGDWVLFLGADDELAGENALSAATAQLQATDAGVLAGEVAYADGRVYRLAAKPQPVARNFLHHQGAFYRRALLASPQAFDDTLRIMADYDLNLRLWKIGIAFRSFAMPIAVCGVRGLSDRGEWAGYREEIAVRHRYFPSWKCWCWDALSLLRFVRKRIIVGLS